MNNFKTCTSCGVEKIFGAFPKNGINKKTGRRKYRADCKPCHSYKNTNAKMMQMVEKYPNNYISCNECDRYFRKSRRDYRLKGECPHCDSRDLDD